MLRRTPIKRTNSFIKRSPIRKVGKVGKSNATANKNLAAMWHEKSIYYCEVHRERCVGTMFGLQNLHRHPRIWYRSNPELLYAFEQVIRGCQMCHDEVDGRSLKHSMSPEEKIKLFELLRGPEL